MTQSELTPEQRQRIYLEEKARMEIRQQLEPKSTPSKSNGAAAVLSLVIPGAGQMYKDKIGKGFAWMFSIGLSYLMSIYGFSNANNVYIGDTMEGTGYLFIVLALVLHILCIINAHRTSSVSKGDLNAYEPELGPGYTG
jgi:TM2 domain-containing membrane protein YozV